MLSLSYVAMDLSRSCYDNSWFFLFCFETTI